MDFGLLKIVTNKLANIIEMFGELSLKEAKQFYTSENACNYPYSDDMDLFVHNVLQRCEGIIYNKDTQKYHHTAPRASVTSTSKSAYENREKFFTSEKSPKEAVLKRSLSAPKINSDESEASCELNSPHDNKPRYQQMRSKQRMQKNSRSKSEQRSKGVAQVQFQNFTLIGDDFLLGFAIFSEKEQGHRYGGILQAGFCISGLTISAATQRIRGLSKPFQKALVYLGSFDVIDGMELIEIINRFEEFVKVCKSKKIQVVACTLAPLPFYDSKSRVDTLIGFNKFLKSKAGVSIIDVNKVFVDSEGNHKEDCYNDVLRKVSGSNRMVMLWNDHGREEFKRIIMKNLGHALLDDQPGVHDKL